MELAELLDDASSRAVALADGYDLTPYPQTCTRDGCAFQDLPCTDPA